MYFTKDHNEENKQNMRRQVVPIYSLIDKEYKACATAIILDCGLIITAAHTFYDGKGSRTDEKFVIQESGKYYKLFDPIYDKFSFDYTSIRDSIYHDLCIYKIPVDLTVVSDLTLFVDLNEKMPVIIKGYPVSDSTPFSKHSTILNVVSSNRKYDNGKIELEFSNCFKLEHPIPPGISGGPVLLNNPEFVNNKVLGMIVYGPENYDSDFGCTAIKAEYIMKIIDEVI